MSQYAMKKLFLILLMVFVSSSVTVASETEMEYKLKALYITRLADFIVWPDITKKKTFKICIDSTDKVAIQLKQIKLDAILNRQVEIINYPSETLTSECNFLYISHDKVDLSLVNTLVFTLSSQTDFAERGGMIEFYIDHGKVRMKANLHAVNQAGLKVSSKLLRLLKIVKQMEGSE